MTDEVAEVLRGLGYTLALRGTIKVKGKGEMQTYFLTEGPNPSVVQ